MAKYKNGIFGTLRGGISNLICYRHYFKNIIRIKPKVIVKSSSLLLEAEQSRVTNIAAVWQAMKSINIDKHWFASNYKLSPWTEFFITYKSYFNLFYPVPYANFILASGTITPTPITKITLSATLNRCRCYWDPALLDNTQKANDRARIIVFNLTMGIIITSHTFPSRYRSVGDTIVYFPSGFLVSNLCLTYLVFLNNSQTLCSTSTYKTKNF